VAAPLHHGDGMSTSLLPILLTPILQLLALPAPPAPTVDDVDAPSIVHVHPTGYGSDDPDPDHAQGVVLKLPNGSFEAAAQ
jgi:hypothetical protein